MFFVIYIISVIFSLTMLLLISRNEVVNKGNNLTLEECFMTILLPFVPILNVGLGIMAIGELFNLHSDTVIFKGRKK